MALPDSVESLEEYRFGPFITARRLRLGDGRIVESTAWHQRKGHGLIDRSRRPGRRLAWSAVDRRGWWIAFLFMVGAGCFAMGAFPPLANSLGTWAAWVFFIGSIFFTSAAYLQFYEASNAAESLDGSDRTSKPVRIRSASIGWWATAIQLVGTVAFNISTFNATRDLSVRQQDLLIWAPDVFGSICFLVASGLVIAETHDRIRGIFFRSLESRIAGINMFGSIAFGISAIGAFIVPSTGELLSVPLVNIFTFIGAAFFFVGAVLLIPDMSSEPETAPA